ncbi:Uncharacterized protein SCF082_LOCUS26505, partial [Durusdinium trenchii]
MAMKHVLWGLVAAACLSTATGLQAEDVYGLAKGAPDLKSAGPMAFGPNGILFVGDSKGAALFAIQTGDDVGNPSEVSLNITDLPAKLAKVLRAKAGEIEVTDLAVNPLSGHAYLSVHVVGEGRRRRNLRGETITDLAYADGHVLISGLREGETRSAVRSLKFPFQDADEGAGLEIYHAAHGRVEDYSPIRTFIPFTIDGEPNVLAGFVCTPLVRFPLKQIQEGTKIQGTTVAELGNRNRPLDMIAYKKGGQDFLLLANSARGVMKISTENIGRQDGLTEQVRFGGTAGQTYETIDSLN